MNCTKCGSENLDSAKFCKKCGHELTKNEIKQVKQKHSVKISGGKIKFVIIAVVIIGLIGAGAMSFKKKTDEKRILSVEYLEGLDERTEEECKILENILYDDMDKKEIDAGLDKCTKFTKEYAKAIEIFVAHTKEMKFSDDAVIKEFIKKYDILEGETDMNEMSNIVSDIKANSSKLKKFGLNEKQIEKYVAIWNEVYSSAKLFDDIKIEKKIEQIEADYSEQENNKIPAGYSIVTTEPQNGEKESVAIIVDGEKKGSGKVITKKPQNGIKMIGSGNAEDIAKQGKNKLNQIIKLWQEQNFTAAEILPFLSEENKNKAPEWESSYKKVIFNWKRFDKVEPILGQVSFKENTVWNKKDETYPFIMNLPITVSYYAKDDTPKIPFYYSAEKDEWVSGNGTFVELFKIIQKQSIEAEISPTSFTFMKAGDCKKDKEIKIKSASVNGADNLKIDFSVSLLYQIKFTLAVDSLDSDTKVGYSSSLPLTLIDSANKNKSTVLTGNDFEYSSFFDGDCLCSSNISFAFFK